MAQTFFYDLSGGINLAATKTDLGLSLKKIYWSDSKNVEILFNKGFIRQNGNTLFATLQSGEEILAIHQLKKNKVYKLLIVTKKGNLYVYNPSNSTFTTVNKTISGLSRPCFVDYLNGVIVSSKYDTPFYIKNNDTFDVEVCNLKDSSGSAVKTDIITTYKGRVWAASDSTVYFSALGKYNDFTTSNDAGYINNFYTDTDEITAMKPYKDYLAIYKKKRVYLLSGSSPTDFAITLFADKGTSSFSSVVDVNNKQYFLNSGIIPLVVGDLNQVVVGNEISLNIRPEFDKFDKTRFDEVTALHYDKKNQIWFFIPYKSDEYFHTIWIYDYENDAWFKRVLPQNITTACVFDEYILTADTGGKIYLEDSGSSFCGEAISFMWKSPFICIGDTNVRKTIDEFFFILDESYDNNFNFSVYKNYDGDYQDDVDLIFSTNVENLNWHMDNSITSQNFLWDSDDNQSFWATNTNSIYKAEISESNYSVQLCVEGSSAEQNTAVIGLEFKEIYADE